MSQPLSQQGAKGVQLSGWVRQLQKHLIRYGNDLDADEAAPSMEEQIIFVQQQYELLSILYEVSLGMDNPDGIQKIVGVDADLIAQEAARSAVTAQ